METTTNKNAATFVHLSALTQYFIPFGNFIFPIVIWSSVKKGSPFVEQHGRQAINFQLSLFLYCLVLCLIAIPILIFTVLKNIPASTFINDNEVLVENFSVSNITGIVVVAVMAALIFCFLKVTEFFLIIYASVKAANGEAFKYPLTINFIKGEQPFEPAAAEPELQAEA